jgi:nitrate reductase gamma subunit
MDKTMFAQALTTIPHLFSSGFYGMVYEHLLGCFIPKDLFSRFSKLFQAIVVVTHGGIFRWVALVLGLANY